MPMRQDDEQKLNDFPLCLQAVSVTATSDGVDESCHRAR